jgi:Trk K+ transport system NAD-binding subunit
VIWGEYTDPATWSAAHIPGAGYIVISKDERLTANIVLGIREQAKGTIIAVVDKLSFDRYLRFAGADFILSPKDATGRILAHHATINHGGDTSSAIPGLDRLSIDLIGREEKELRLINIPVVAGSRASGKTLADLDLFDRYGVVALFLWKSGTFIPRPAPSESIDHNTSVFLFGRADAVVDAITVEFDPDGHKEAVALIAGFGDVGAAAYRELQAAGITCIIVDSRTHGLPQEIIGNAEDEVVLRNAGIDKAQFCIVALNNDDVNIFTTLMARNLNPSIRILARANEPASVDKLYRAGADYVTLLPTIGAQIIGRIVLSDRVTIILDLPDGSMVVMKRVSAAAKTISVGKIQKKSGVRVLGIEGKARTVVAPVENEVIVPNDAVIAVGDAVQLKKFLHIIA